MTFDRDASVLGRRVRALCAELGMEVRETSRPPRPPCFAINLDGVEIAAEVAVDASRVRLESYCNVPTARAGEVASRVERLQDAAWDRTCSWRIDTHSGEIRVSVAVSLYSDGLSYYALQGSVDDLNGAVRELRAILAPVQPGREG